MFTLLKHIPVALPKPQKDRDLARRSAAAASETDGTSLPNLKPDGMGVPFIGPEILTFPFTSSLSGDGILSTGEEATDEDCTTFRVGWNDFRSA